MSSQFTIKDITLSTQSRRVLGIARNYKYYVKFTLGDRSLTTKKSKEKENSVHWDETFIFNANNACHLEAIVYQKHNVQRDEIVGSLKDTVGGLLTKAKDGVVDEALTVTTGKAFQVDLKIKFAFAIEANAAQDQARKALDEAKKAGDTLPTSSEVLSIAKTAVTTGTTVVSNLQTLQNALQKMKGLTQTADVIAEIHPYVSLAWSTLSALIKIPINQLDRDSRITRLLSTMARTFEFVNFADTADALNKIEAHQELVTLLLQQMTECGFFIAEYAKDNFATRMARYAVSGIDSKITDFDTKLKDLQDGFLQSTALRSNILVFRMMTDVQNIGDSIDLKDIPYASGARYTREKMCLPGTRESVIEEIYDVLNDPREDAPRACLLTGVAGSGKSAIAHTIARRYDDQQRLGSSFCFARSDVARRNPENFFSTIALDLADRDPQYKAELCKAVKDNRALRASLSPLEQVEELIVKPSKDIPVIGPLVVVIDALDESGDPADRAQLLSALSQSITKLPSNLRFLITSRPELDILAKLLPGSHMVHKQLGDVPHHTVDEDIQKFIYSSLRQNTKLDPVLLRQEWCPLLVKRSQHLFQWASTACRFIEGEQPKRDPNVPRSAYLDPAGRGLDKRLELLLRHENGQTAEPLHWLYHTILGKLFESENAQHCFRETMAIILALNEPLSLSALSHLLSNYLDIEDTVKRMASLLEGALDEQKPIQFLHTSFRDFLLEDCQNSSFHVSIKPLHHLYLGQSMLACMQKMLRFNICDLKDSQIPNAAVPGLQDQVKANIPSHFSYACQYWMNHLQHHGCTPSLSEEVINFFKSFFPYWLEAISLLSLSSPSIYIPAALQTCITLQSWTKSPTIVDLASEASQFIQVFAPVIKDSTPHLYLSAMPQIPSRSSLSSIWSGRLHHHLTVTLGHPPSWPADILRMQGDGEVCSVAWSPDGNHIVSGSEDQTIRIWNAMTGQCVAGPLQGHTGSVQSIVYSPDGSHVASGSSDQTIRIWSAKTGQCVAGPLQGHTGSVWSIVYSPDGSHIASGSSDQTIRIWNAMTGQCMAGPLQGHTGSVPSIVYSPDGSHIASGSSERTIEIWDAKTGQSVAGPLQGHTGQISSGSVVYSPDRRHIASCSVDQTIRIWSAKTGQCVAGPLQGHTNPVLCIVYSPDGSHVASGSSDQTIRIWSAKTGQCVAGPLQGHTGSVWSIAYSPDGSHIVSGSEDQTMRIWDAKIGQYVAGPLAGHADQVNSVVYSPDGNCIASGSEDETIRIWSAETGQCVAGPLQGHTGSVQSIVYSPDGSHIASVSDDQTIRIWNLKTDQCVVDPLQGHTGEILSVAYSPDGCHFASGSYEHTISIWDAKTGQCVAGPLQGHTCSVRSIVYSPDGSHIASGSSDQTIRIWNAKTGQCVAGPLAGHTDWIGMVAYSPDGSHIASGSDDHTIRIWDTKTGQCVAGPLQGHTGQVWSVAYSPDGCYIASGSLDQTLRVWDAKTGQQVMGPWEGAGPIWSISYSPDGTSIAAACGQAVRVSSLQHPAAFGDWHQEEDWLISGDAYICWIPPWVRHDSLYHPRNTLVISSQPYKLDFSDFVYGEQWTSCWSA